MVAVMTLLGGVNVVTAPGNVIVLLGNVIVPGCPVIETVIGGGDIVMHVASLGHVVIGISGLAGNVAIGVSAATACRSCACTPNNMKTIPSTVKSIINEILCFILSL